MYDKLEDDGLECKRCDSPDVCAHISKKLSFTKTRLEQAPQGSGAGFGGGNPVVLAELKDGEVVLVLSSGIGLDSFLAGMTVGNSGRVVGVDEDTSNVEKARANALKGGHKNVEFKQGSLQKLPVGDNSFDVVISNCAVNLAKDKLVVFGEIFRALKRGGRLVAADIVLLKKLPEDIRVQLKEYVGCLAGAILKEDYLAALKKAGFSDIKILSETTFPMEHMSYDSTANAVMGNIGLRKNNLRAITQSVASIKLSARR
jgi:SAM-dependent methyltransferase